ncbi:MAG: polysaccharide biosynthesis/export family protein [Muribaculaceae bacterium]|nr:polysaccharide biosynthesis/export family protein [Muribaculaceae bacterium]
MKFTRTLCVAAIAISLASCNSSKKVLYMQDATVNVPERIVNLNEIKVQPGDKITIMVSCKDPELAQMFNLVETNTRIGQQRSSTNYVSAYSVDEFGDINFPVLGSVHVAGLTRTGIADLLTKRLESENLLKNPVVTVEFANLRVSVFGDVAKPATYAITNDRITLYEALSMAGDLNVTGKRDGVYVIREEDGQRTTYKLDLRSADVMNSPVFYLKQNDVIYVEPNGTKAGQSNVSENSLKSAGLWVSVASLLTSVAVLIWK